MKEKDEVKVDRPFDVNYKPIIGEELFETFVEDLFNRAQGVRSKKHSAYFSDTDVVRSFTKCAQIRNKALPTMIADLMVKHFQSISDMVDAEYGAEETLSVTEPFSIQLWDEKFIDLLNYTLKLYASIRVIRGS